MMNASELSVRWIKEGGDGTWIAKVSNLPNCTIRWSWTDSIWVAEMADLPGWKATGDSIAEVTKIVNLFFLTEDNSKILEKKK